MNKKKLLHIGVAVVTLGITYLAIRAIFRSPAKPRLEDSYEDFDEVENEGSWEDPDLDKEFETK